MTENQIKELCKYMIDNGSRPLTDEQKELLKLAIDQAQNFNDLLAVVVASIIIK